MGTTNKGGLSTLFIFGTRPEAIKCAPLIRALTKSSAFDVKICITAQHRYMLDQVMEFFDLKADFDLNVMTRDQTLTGLVSKVMSGLESVINDAQPSLIVVQGDTTTAFLGALAGYYHKIKVAHLEAGLRSGDRYAPWPEEGNRLMISHLGDLHFAPTPGAMDHLRRENIHDNVFVTGNTVIDALILATAIVGDNQDRFAAQFSHIPTDGRFILVTAHRRESFGEPFENMCRAMREIAVKFPDVQIIYPVHLNPNVREPVNRLLADQANIFLIEPIDYPEMVWLMQHAYIVLTDSGGVQEEAPALGKPVLVMRDVTERQEGVDAGTAVLVGTDTDRIVKAASTLLNDQKEYDKMSNAINPYGDGTASEQILNILLQYFQL